VPLKIVVKTAIKLVVKTVIKPAVSLKSL